MLPVYRKCYLFIDLYLVLCSAFLRNKFHLLYLLPYISIWANHLLTYLLLPHTDVFLTEKTIVLITDSISSQNRQY